MRIEFRNIIPLPLKEEVFSSDSVYNRTFQIDSNEKYLLMSQSGKGKTTFLSIIYGARKDYLGEFLIDDVLAKNIKIEDWTELRKNKLSMIFQDLKLFDNHSVIDNLLVKNKLTNYKSEREIQMMLHHLGIENLINRSIDTLSQGQKQRVAIIRALLQPFEILLMDEPFSHLDQENIQLAIELIDNEASSKGAGYLISSLGSNHNMGNYKKLIIS